MGSKIIILLGLIISALFLYVCVDRLAPKTYMQNAVVDTKVEKNQEPIVENRAPSVAAKPPVESAPAIPEEEPVDKKIVVERISTPAFGFMSGSKNQIVALMSDNDQDGVLAKTLDELCKNMECSKDIRYENDIIDAKWQDGVVDIIKLLTDGSIKGGSLFIEGNVLKLEGSVESKKISESLSTILDGIKSETFKVENYTKLSPNIKDDKESKKEDIAKVDENKSDKKIAKNKTQTTKVQEKQIPVKEKIEKTETKPAVVAVEKAKKRVVKTTKEKIKKKIEKSAPVVEPDPIAQPVMETTLDAEKQISTEHSIYEEIPAEDIVAKPVMETTKTAEDAESRVKAILKDIKKKQTSDDIVAKPHMETTIE